MLGLKAARRSTAPISSATPVSRARRTARAAGPRVADTVAAGAGGRRRRPGRPASRRAPSRAVGLGDHRRAVDAVAGRRREVGHGDRARHRARARRATTSTGWSGATVAVAAGVRGVERRPPMSPSARGSGRAYRQSIAVVAHPALPDGRDQSSGLDGAARRPAPPGPPRAPRGRPVSGHDRTRSTCSGGASRPTAEKHAGPGRDDHRRHPQRLGQRAGVERAGPAEGDQRQAGRVDAPCHRDGPQSFGHGRVDGGDHVGGVHSGRRQRPSGGVAVEAADAREGVPASMRPRTTSASVTVGCGAAPAVAGRPGHGSGRCGVRRPAPRRRRAARSSRRRRRWCGWRATAAAPGSRRPPRRRRLGQATRAIRQTSVDVPPMSKLMASPQSLAAATAAAARTPAGRPDSSSGRRAFGAGRDVDQSTGRRHHPDGRGQAGEPPEVRRDRPGAGRR